MGGDLGRGVLSDSSGTGEKSDSSRVVPGYSQLVPTDPCDVSDTKWNPHYLAGNGACSTGAICLIPQARPVRVGKWFPFVLYQVILVP